ASVWRHNTFPTRSITRTSPRSSSSREKLTRRRPSITSPRNSVAVSQSSRLAPRDGASSRGARRLLSILGQFRLLYSAKALQLQGGAVEHHLQLAGDADELPALLDAVPGLLAGV